MLTKVKKEALLEGLHLGNLRALNTYLKNLENAVGRIGHTQGSALPALAEMCADKPSDTDFLRELRSHLRLNENILVLKVLRLKEACSNLVHYMKSSGQMDELSSSLKQCMDVRWNSFHRMLESIQKVYDEVSHTKILRDGDRLL